MVDPDAISITVHQGPSGVWECQPYLWRNQVTGKWTRKLIRMPEARSLEEAERIARSRVREIVLEGDPLSSACAAYMKHLRASHTPQNTIRSYRSSARLVVRGLGKVRTRKLTALDVRDFEKWLLADAPAGAGLAPSSAAAVHWYLSSLYAWLIDEGRADSNPVRLVRAPSEGRRHVAHRVLVLDDEEQARVVSWCEDVLCGAPHHPGSRELLAACSLMALDTGMRVGEICALRKKDVQTEVYGSGHGRVHVCGTVVRTEGGGLRRQDKTKGGRDRWVDLSPRACGHVRAWLSWRGGIGPEDPLFSLDTTWTNPDRISSGYSRHMRGKLGLPRKSSFHTLRHTVATNLLASGEVSLSDVSAMLGHAYQGTTLEFYGGTLPASRDRAADAAGKIMDWQQKTYGNEGKQQWQ